MKKKLAAAISVAAAALGTSVALCSPAAADTDCPYDMSTPAGQQALVDATVAASNQVSSDEASYGPTGNQALADQDRQIQTDNSRLILACSGNSSQASSQALANSDQMVANDQAAAEQQAAELEAMNAPEPGVLANGQPDCGYYQAQIDSIPTPVEIGFLKLPDTLDPQNVVLTCGLANSVIGGVDLLTGNLPSAIESGQQANAAFCNSSARVIPFVTLPLPC
ncbi:hypothetical protein [Mycobacterium sp. 141]|uniref:hypothetical protein n=1 Tax=Mycobacterium sp. 141 TaxID=1120797 RepID=UPI0012DF3821|nr:hypothetical protein [Mycobacterium sp. 141]